MSSKYTAELHTDGEWVAKDTRSDKQAAIKLADELHAQNAGLFAARVVTEAGTVVHEQPAVVEDSDDEDAAVAVARTKPWSRVAEAKFEAPEVEGYTLAYTRSRIATGIYRADDKSGWLVLDTRTNTRTEHENTTQARIRTNELAVEYVKAQAEVKAAAKAEKERVAKEKKAAREQAAKEKADAKEKAAAEKAAAKAEAEKAKESADAAA